MEKRPWYEQSVEEVSRNLSTDPEKGLSPDEARVAQAWGIEKGFSTKSEDRQPRSLLIYFIVLPYSTAWENESKNREYLG